MSEEEESLTKHIQLLNQGGSLMARAALIFKQQQDQIRELQEQNKQLTESLNQIITHLNFRPDSKGAKESQKDFEERQHQEGASDEK